MNEDDKDLDAEELEDDEEEEAPEEDGWINAGDFYHWDPFKGP